MTYKVVENYVTSKDKVEKVFDTFKEAIKSLREAVEECGEYFVVEKGSDVFYKVWYRRECYPFGLQYAGCLYLKKVA